MPLISIILPTFNRTKYLRPAIESAFAQTFGDWEMIIADDGSAEETRDYLRTITNQRVRTLWLPHSGNPLRTHPDRRWCYTHCDRIDEEGNSLTNERLRMHVARGGSIVAALLKLDAEIAMPTVVADRQLVAEVGEFDERQRFCEDYDLCLRLALRSEVAVVPEPLCSIRAHGEHYSADRIGEYSGLVQLYGKIATLVPDAELHALCQRLRTEKSLTLAGLLGDKREAGAMCRTLFTACAFSWRYPNWWFGALKALARAVVPQSLLSAYRRRRRSLQ